MRTNNVKFDFDDVLITPKTHTDITSRYEDINPYCKDSMMLPIITAPMDTVVNLKNMTTFRECNINVALPRTISYDMLHDRYNATLHSGEYIFPDHTFISLGLCEMKNIINKPEHYDYLVGDLFILDVANGHMEEVYETAQAFKLAFPSIKLMIGNIANPESYEWYARGKFVDYIRIGIGSGGGCLTSQNTGVGYSMGSLIKESYKIKQTLGIEIEKQWETYNDPKLKNLYIKKPSIRSNQLPKIVADGGMKNYSDIIKALGLGADYVMFGSIFNKALESAGQNYLYNIKISSNLAMKFYDWGFPIKKGFYGMSTKIAQKKMGKTVLKTSEGIVRKQKVEYRLASWVENFEHYLRTAMSYSDARTLEQFIGKADFEIITENAYNRFNK